ncbi:MAG TPA: hypothetical protein DCO79_01960 [Spirochaeta sp.]|nr:hypothetical protein [Spirochaeta sp.]
MSELIPASILLPTTIEQASTLRLEGFYPVGGGTDIMVRNHAFKKLGRSIKAPLFSCRNIPETRRLVLENNRLIIGSSMTISEITAYGHCPELLRQSLLSIASPGIRNTATLAGNICNASPAADSLPALYLYDAAVESSGPSGKREIPIADFIKGPGQIDLHADEIITAVSFELNNLTPYFRKVGTRAANALSKLSIASLLSIENNVFASFRLALGACAPTVVRSEEAENIVCGSSPDDVQKHLDEILKIYAGIITPIDDQRSTAAYRRNTALRLIENLLKSGGN